MAAISFGRDESDCMENGPNDSPMIDDRLRWDMFLTRIG